MRKNTINAQRKLGFLLLLPLLFWLIPSSWFEGRPSICLIRRIFGVPCPGCGMVRALSCLAHGNVRKAWSYNHLVALVAPLLGYTWDKALLRIYQQWRHPGYFSLDQKRFFSDFF
jgi:hypothetical protein